MTVRSEVYLCSICGNMVEVVRAGKGTLVCCGKQMQLLAENSQDASQEKHVPVIQSTAHGFQVVVGKVAHPMEDEHFIEWIELIADGRVLRRYLHPGEKPEAEFCVTASTVTARAYCNLHGLWKFS